MYIIALLCSPGYIFIFWLALFDVSRFIDDLLSVQSSLIFFYCSTRHSTKNRASLVEMYN